MHTPHLRPHLPPLTGDAALDWLHRLSQRAARTLHAVRRPPAKRQPSVEQIVDVIMATPCGQSCAVRLDPRRTRIANLEWLLPICVQQFGTTIAFQEQPDGEEVLLTIAITGRRERRARAPRTEAHADEPAAS